MTVARAAALAAALTLGLLAQALACATGKRRVPPGRATPSRAACPLVFDSERICLSIVGDSLEVRGSYLLLAGGRARRFPLFYPFPRDSLLGGWRFVSLAVRAGASGPALPARWEAVPGQWVVRWWLPPCPSDTLVVEAIYRQQLPHRIRALHRDDHQGLGQPAARAAFEIRLPAGAEPLEFSFPFTRREGEETVWTYEATDFLPEQDIIVRWRQ